MLEYTDVDPPPLLLLYLAVAEMTSGCGGDDEGVIGVEFRMGMMFVVESVG